MPVAPEENNELDYEKWFNKCNINSERKRQRSWEALHRQQEMLCTTMFFRGVEESERRKPISQLELKYLLAREYLVARQTLERTRPDKPATIWENRVQI